MTLTNNNELKEKIEEILKRRPSTWVETITTDYGSSHYDTHVDEDSLEELTTLFTEMVEGELKRFAVWLDEYDDMVEIFTPVREASRDIAVKHYLKEYLSQERIIGK